MPFCLKEKEILKSSDGPSASGPSLVFRLISFTCPWCLLHYSHGVPLSSSLSQTFLCIVFCLFLSGSLFPTGSRLSSPQPGEFIHPLGFYFTVIPSEEPGLIFFCRAYHNYNTLTVCIMSIASCPNSNSVPPLPNCNIHKNSNHGCFIQECVLCLWGLAHQVAHTMCPINRYGTNEWMKFIPTLGFCLSQHIREQCYWYFQVLLK